MPQRKVWTDKTRIISSRIVPRLRYRLFYYLIQSLPPSTTLVSKLSQLNAFLFLSKESWSTLSASASKPSAGWQHWFVNRSLLHPNRVCVCVKVQFHDITDQKLRRLADIYVFICSRISSRISSSSNKAALQQRRRSTRFLLRVTGKPLDRKMHTRRQQCKQHSGAT